MLLEGARFRRGELERRRHVGAGIGDDLDLANLATETKVFAVNLMAAAVTGSPAAFSFWFNRT